MDLRDLDLEAMRQAIAELLKAEPTWNGTIAGMLQAQPFEQVGAFAAGVLQVRNLHLKPHECPPVDTLDGAPADCYGRRGGEIPLLRKMLSLNISRYDPDPLAAIERAERARVA
jgi:hypothetical protein